MAWKPEAYSVQSKAVCASLSSKLRGASKLTEVSYGLQAWALMNCGKKAVPGSAVEAVQNAVTSKSVSKLYAAVMAAEALEKIGLPIDVDYKAIVKSVVKLQRSDGTFKLSSSKATGSALTAGMAYHVLAAAFEHVKGSQQAVSSISKVVEKVETLFGGADGSESSELSLGTGDKLATTALAVSGALRLAHASGEEVAVTLEQLTAFGSFLVAHTNVPDVSTLYYVLVGLRAMEHTNIGAVLALQLRTTTLSSGSKGDLVEVVVSTVFGEPVSTASVTLEAAINTATADELPGVASVALESRGDGRYTLDLLRTDPPPAVYQLVFRVVADSFESPDDGALRILHVVSAAAVGRVTLYTTEGTKRTAETTATHPQAMKETLQLHPGTVFHMEFPVVAAGHGTPLRPHQVFVQLLDGAGRTAATLVAAAAEDAAGTHSVSLDVSDRRALQDITEAGDYTVQLLVGDVTLSAPIRWQLGRVSIRPPAPVVAKEEILYTKPLMHDSDVTLKPLREIRHQFRAPEARPPVVVSMAFAGGVAAPMALFVLAALAKGNFRRFPVGAATLPAIVFHGSIGAALVLFFLYWVDLTMLGILPVLGLLGLVMFFSGNRVLSHLVQEDEKRPS